MLCGRYDGERGVDEDEAGGDRYDDDGGRRRPRGRRSESDSAGNCTGQLVYKSRHTCENDSNIT